METVSLVVVVVYGSIGRLLAVHCVTAVKTGVDEEEATRLTAGGALTERVVQKYGETDHFGH